MRFSLTWPAPGGSNGENRRASYARWPPRRSVSSRREMKRRRRYSSRIIENQRKAKIISIIANNHQARGALRHQTAIRWRINKNVSELPRHQTIYVRININPRERLEKQSSRGEQNSPEPYASPVFSPPVSPLSPLLPVSKCHDMVIIINAILEKQ